MMSRVVTARFRHTAKVSTMAKIEPVVRVYANCVYEKWSERPV